MFQVHQHPACHPRHCSPEPTGGHRGAPPSRHQIPAATHSQSHCRSADGPHALQVSTKTHTHTHTFFKCLCISGTSSHMSELYSGRINSHRLHSAYKSRLTFSCFIVLLHRTLVIQFYSLLLKKHTDWCKQGPQQLTDLDLVSLN